VLRPAVNRAPDTFLPPFSRRIQVVQLWLAKHAHVDLGRNLIRILRLMIAVPAANRLYVLAEVIEELPWGYRDVATERARIVAPTQQHEVV
jgi:hypothetical protein